MPTTLDVIEPVRKDARNDQGQFEFQVQVWKLVWTYLTNDSSQKTSTEAYQNNFSSFYVLKDNNGGTLWIIWFSIGWVSLFDGDYTNQRDFELKRDDEKYQVIHKMERRIRANNNTPYAEDIEFLRSLWEEYNGSGHQDAMN